MINTNIARFNLKISWSIGISHQGFSWNMVNGNASLEKRRKGLFSEILGTSVYASISKKQLLFTI
jgi:hypothetical protein